ncbi:unnamed protein product [Darwinula stevensoni]|uniref:BTB domain-containing protein n=1 Tax=Darwinula stevensoni TaxID=69355 RepID=A0A7R8X562_9CRUS|nr:unnamed protein product [Darwinula stevensoni]CAG0880538.1 unnamed protein product [Darwinula stevensoni]
MDVVFLEICKVMRTNAEVVKSALRLVPNGLLVRDNSGEFLQEEFHKLWSMGSMCDAMLVGHDGFVKCHRFMLEAASPFVQDLIRSCPLQEVTSLTIPHLSFSTLHNFVSLLYGCSLSDVQLPDLEELLDLTKILHIETLAHKLMHFIYGKKPSVHVVGLQCLLQGRVIKLRRTTGAWLVFQAFISFLEATVPIIGSALGHSVRAKRGIDVSDGIGCLLLDSEVIKKKQANLLLNSLQQPVSVSASTSSGSSNSNKFPSVKDFIHHRIKLGCGKPDVHSLGNSMGKAETSLNEGNSFMPYDGSSVDPPVVGMDTLAMDTDDSVYGPSVIDVNPTSWNPKFEVTTEDPEMQVVHDCREGRSKGILGAEVPLGAVAQAAFVKLRTPIT